MRVSTNQSGARRYRRTPKRAPERMAISGHNSLSRAGNRGYGPVRGAQNPPDTVSRLEMHQCAANRRLAPSLYILCRAPPNGVRCALGAAHPPGWISPPASTRFPPTAEPLA